MLDMYHHANHVYMYARRNDHFNFYVKHISQAKVSTKHMWEV